MALILVVDDEDVGQTIALNLARWGHQVVRVDNGDQALQTILRIKPDLVILDISPPLSAGLGTAQFGQRLRAAQLASRLPILFLTAGTDVPGQMQVYNPQSDDYLVKPFDWGDLEARVRALLGRAPSP